MSTRTIPLLLTAMLAGCGAPQPVITAEDITAKSLPVADKFQTQLQSQLGAALKTGGPASAIEVCHQAAPAIAAALGEETGASIRRVSLRNRNPANVPNARERAILEQFETGPIDAAGKPRVKTWQDGNSVYFMRAIPMQDQPCAVCHGTNISPDIQARLAALYPDDKATGFKEGDTRGALSITWPATAFTGK